MNQEQTFFTQKRGIIIAVGIAVLAMGLPLGSKLVKEKSTPPQGNAPGISVVPPPSETPITESTPEEDAATTASFAGSAWKLDDISATLEPGGLLKVKTPKLPITLEGSWTVKGKTMLLSAMGKTFSLQIDGDKLVKDGKSITRVQQ